MEINHNFSNFSNLKIYINNIEFDLKTIDINESNIRLITNTSNQNYIPIENWVELTLKKNSQHKVMSNFHNIVLYGIFPIDYSFNQFNIKVTFSVDEIYGDLDVLKLRLLRKAKLKKIEKVRNKNNI
jgi:hypothetical protein